jgi:hypothetical protein
LQQRRCNPDGSCQIKDGAARARAVQLLQIKPAKNFHYPSAEQQKNYECGAAAPTPDVCRDGPDSQEQQPNHAKSEWEN